MGDTSPITIIYLFSIIGMILLFLNVLYILFIQDDDIISIIKRKAKHR
jgi:hypothetical protein